MGTDQRTQFEVVMPEQENIKPHIAPILHNTIGSLLASAIAVAAVAFVAFIRPVRLWLINATVPAWLFASAVVLIVLLVTLVRKLQRELRNASGRAKRTQASVAQLGDTMNANAAELKKRAEAEQLDPVELNILELLAKNKLTRHELTNKFKIAEVKLDYFLTRLQRRKLIEIEMSSSGGSGILGTPRSTNHFYALTHDGTEHLIEKGLL
jgi:anaerobic C4-dicarboxylate transporter